MLFRNVRLLKYVLKVIHHRTPFPHPVVWTQTLAVGNMEKPQNFIKAVSWNCTAYYVYHEVNFQAPVVASAWKTMVARNEQNTHNYSQFLDSDTEIGISLLGGIAHARLLYQRVQSFIEEKLKHLSQGIFGTHVDYRRMFLPLFDMSSERDHFLSLFVLQPFFLANRISGRFRIIPIVLLVLLSNQGLREKLLLVGKLCQKRAPSKTNCT